MKHETWPNIIVPYVDHHTPYNVVMRKHFAHQWLFDNNVVHESIGSLDRRYYTLYIKEPKQMTMFLLLWGDIVEDRIYE